MEGFEMKKGLLFLSLIVIMTLLAQYGWAEEKTDNKADNPEKFKGLNGINVGFSCPDIWLGIGFQSVALTLRSWKENEGIEWNLCILGFSKKEYNFLNSFEIPSGSEGAIIRKSTLRRYLSDPKDNLYPYLSFGIISGVWKKGEWINVIGVIGLAAGVGINLGGISLELGYGTYVFWYKETRESDKSSYFALTTLF